MYVSPAEPGKQSAGWQMEILFVIFSRERKIETNTYIINILIFQ
jgi:hypothetical protein